MEWCVAGYDVLMSTRGRPKCIYLKEVYPLRIMKQIIAMLCSVRGPQLAQMHPYITRLLLDREAVGMPDGLRIFVHLPLAHRHARPRSAHRSRSTPARPWC